MTHIAHTQNPNPNFLFLLSYFSIDDILIKISISISVGSADVYKVLNIESKLLLKLELLLLKSIR